MKLSPLKLARKKKGWSLSRLAWEVFKINREVSSETLRRLEINGPDKIAFGHFKAASQALTDSPEAAKTLMDEAGSFNYDQ